MKRLYLCGALLGWVSSTQASPPIDVTKPESPNASGASSRMKFREEDMVMQDVNDPPLYIEKELATCKIDVIGRHLPTRQGRPLLRCARMDKVKFLKDSGDGRWAAVQSMRSGKKAWVPKTALEIPPQKIKQQN